MQAASEVFNERGLEVSLDEIARHAGVGVGTVYRRFRTKEELVEALFTERIEAVAAAAQAGVWPNPTRGPGSPGSWSTCPRCWPGDAGLRQILMFATHGRDGVAYARQRNAPLVQQLLRPGPAGRAGPQ